MDNIDNARLEGVFDRIMQTEPGFPQHTFITADEFPCISAHLELGTPPIEPTPEQMAITEDLPFLNVAQALGVKVIYESAHPREERGKDGRPASAKYVRGKAKYFGKTIFLRCRNSPMLFVHELVHAVQDHLGITSDFWEKLLIGNRIEFEAHFVECIFSDDGEAYSTMRYITKSAPDEKVLNLFESCRDDILQICNFITSSTLTSAI